MMFNWSYGKPSDEEKEKLLAALGVPDEMCGGPWPLPNMKPSDERDFWGRMASHFPRARIYMGNRELAGQHATVLAYWMGETQPSFAVAIVYKNSVAHHPVYFQWTACEHDYHVTKSGNCWRDYTCRKCGVSYHEDSSG